MPWAKWAWPGRPGGGAHNQFQRVPGDLSPAPDRRMVPLNFAWLPELIYIIGNSSPRCSSTPDFADKVKAVKAAGLPVPIFPARRRQFAEDPALSDFIAPFSEDEPIPATEVTLNDPVHHIHVRHHGRPRAPCCPREHPVRAIHS